MKIVNVSASVLISVKGTACSCPIYSISYLSRFPCIH
ncbi:MAG TPA: hypothetical protein EYP59_03685 [Thiotrichaceae bacterium]|nr:hypothetical protein [Thiotrichaceae bacterium]